MEQVAITGIKESGGLISQAGATPLTLIAFSLLLMGVLFGLYLYFVLSLKNCSIS